jgi:hypothetical protein
VGPTSGQNGFPVWYKDSNDVSLQLCLDGNEPLCGFAAGDFPKPDQPTSFPDNFPGEAFYELAGSTINLPTGKAVLTSGLEAAFATEVPRDGDQITFGRVRIRIDTPGAGHYKVTHPYGTDEFDVAEGGNRTIDFVEDVGIGSPGDFTGAMRSRIDPFLRWDTGFVKGADGSSYVGDPAVAHKITGSSLGTNYFKIEGPDIGGPGVNVVNTDLFTVQGKVATNAGVAPQSVTYQQTSSSGGVLDVFASSQPGQAIQVSGTGVPATRLHGDGSGRYYGRAAYSGSAPPAKVRVSNTSDKPQTDVDYTVTDQVNVADASFDGAAKTLHVKARSSDPNATLSVQGFGDLGSSGEAQFANVSVPPSTVTVMSSRSGSDSAPVTVTAGDAFQPESVKAQTPSTLLVQQGQQVVLDGSASLNATSYSWTQLSGSPVSLSGAMSPTATFTAPSSAQDLTFRLTANGPGGPSTADVTVTVQAIAPPTANAGNDQSVLQGSTVTLDGSASVGATKYSWSQIGGTPVTLSGAMSAKPTFTMPSTNNPLIFQLVVSNSQGMTDMATVTVRPQPDVVTGTAEFRRDKAEWRMSGTASITDNNTISVYVVDTSGQRVRIGQPANVDTVGGWTLRLSGGPVPAAGITSVTAESSRGGVGTLPLSVRN